MAIPAYNRPAVLRSNLEQMLPELRETGVQVFISDDSTNSQTCEMVAQFAEQWPHTHYVRNQPSLGHDRNCLRTLSLPDTDYVWYLSDATRIYPGGIRRILTAIDSETPDFLAVNAKHRTSIDLPSGKYDDPNAVIEFLGWHLTLTGATIYHRRHLEDMQVRYEHFVGTNFIQLGVLLQSLPTAKGGFLWFNEQLIEAHRDKGDSYWKKTALKVFMKDWADFIMNLPDAYPLATKRRAVRLHSRKTGVLEWRELKRLHAQGLLTYDDFKRYRGYWRLVTGVPDWLVAALSNWPILRTSPVANERRRDDSGSAVG